MPSIIKVDQIQSDNGMVNVTSNLASVTISNDIAAPLQITTSFNEKARLISATDAANWQQAIFGYNAGNYYWQLNGGKDGSNNPFFSIYTGTSGTSVSERLKVTGAGVVELVTGQLKFPATANTSSDPNTLDDYEEGTWTPTVFQGSTQITSPTIASGYYVKMGKTLWLGCYFYKSSGAPSASGQWQIRNLPFNVENTLPGSNRAQVTYNGVNGSESSQKGGWQANYETILDLYGQYGTTSWTSGYLEFGFTGTFLTKS